MKLTATKKYINADELTAPSVLEPEQDFEKKNRDEALRLIREGYAYPAGMPELIEVQVDAPFNGISPEYGPYSGTEGDFLELSRSLYLKLVFEGRVHALSAHVWAPSSPEKQDIQKFYV